MSLKEKVSVLSKQASRFQLELSTARSQLQLMESLAVRLESPSPSFGTESKFSSSSNNGDDRLKLELDNKGRQVYLYICCYFEVIKLVPAIDPVIGKSADR